MKRIAPSRVRRAVIAINEWWQAAPSQGAKHLFGLLALLEKGVGKKGYTQFEEEDDFAFWDKYFRVPGQDSDSPYVDPLTRQRRIKTHPHSNVATARKGTFSKSWEAADFGVDANRTIWKLADDYAERFRQRALRKAQSIHRVPVVDLAAWLFRSEAFPDDATAKTLEDRFRKQFPQDPADYNHIFEYRDESPEQIFVSSTPAAGEYEKAIEEALVTTVEPPGDAKTSVGPGLDDDDSILLQVEELLALNTSGVILRGTPGTGKTWYAQRIATKLVTDPDKHIFTVQFHPSYGYEDLIEGYRPTENTKSGFEVVDKVFLEACALAETIDGRVVFIIDEINRGDPARVFGELLTYLERGYRNKSFRLPYSNRERRIPPNLLVLATMNPFDRSITQLDMALVRRFDHIDLYPSGESVGRFLGMSDQFSPKQIELVTSWFETLQRLVPNGVGHTYFLGVTRPEQLRAVWRYRIWPYCESILELDSSMRENVRKSFESMYADLVGQQNAVDLENPG